MCPTIFPPKSGSNSATRESNSFRQFHSFRQELLSYTSSIFRNSFGGKCSKRPPGNLCRSILVVYLLFQIDILLQVGGKRDRLATIVAGPQKRQESKEPFSNTKTNIHDTNQLHRALQISTQTNIVQSLWIYVPQSVATKLHPIRQRIYEYLADPTTLRIVDFSCFSKRVHIFVSQKPYTKAVEIYTQQKQIDK